MKNSSLHTAARPTAKLLLSLLGAYLLFVSLGLHSMLAEQEHRHHGGNDSECFCPFHSPTLIAQAPSYDYEDTLVEKVSEFLPCLNLGSLIFRPSFASPPRAPPSA